MTNVNWQIWICGQMHLSLPCIKLVIPGATVLFLCLLLFLMTALPIFNLLHYSNESSNNQIKSNFMDLLISLAQWVACLNHKLLVVTPIINLIITIEQQAYAIKNRKKDFKKKLQMASKERKEKSFNSLKWCFLAKIIGVKFAIIDRLSAGYAIIIMLL